jgi:integrase
MDQSTAFPNAERNAYKDALNAKEFRMLLEGATLLGESMRLECRFVCLVAGRLGLRAGEICHMEEDWIDWDRSMINVPAQQNCEKGQEGERCGYCKQMASQMTEADKREAGLSQILEWFWKPKTPAAARGVPFGFDPEIEIVMERFFDRYEKFPYSRKTVNRRVDRAAEKAREIEVETTYPHCLRATAATYHASYGLKAIQLHSLFGWERIETARHYVKLTGEHTSRALKDIHSR